jgi:hypothetical protein
MTLAAHFDVTDDDAVVQHQRGHGPGQRNAGDLPLERPETSLRAPPIANA